MLAERKAGPDILKVISMMMIVIFHYFWNNSHDFTVFSPLLRTAVDCCYMIGELGVNCFALISGYFMSVSGKPFRTKKAVTLWLQILFYSLLSAAVVYSAKADFVFNASSAMNIFMPVTSGVWWYATAYFVLYIFSPYINRMLANLSQKEYGRLVLTMLAVYSVLPTLVGVFVKNTESFLNYNRGIWLLVLYVLAGYFRRYEVTFKGRKPGTAAWLGVHTATWAVLITYMGVKEKFPDIFGKSVIADAIYFWRPNTVLMVILSLSLFMVFKDLNISGGKILSFVSSSTFGIYLLHGGRSGSFWWSRVPDGKDFRYSSLVFVDALLVMSVIFLAGMAVEFVRQRIFDSVTLLIEKRKSREIARE